MKKPLTLLVSLFCILVCQATDHVSIRDGSWFVPTNTWSPATLPASGDNVSIWHSVKFDSTDAAQSVSLGSLHLNGALLSISGPATLAAGGGYSSVSASNLVSGVLHNGGTFSHAATATLAIDDGAYFDNEAGCVYDFAGDGTLIGLFRGYAFRGYFANYGLVRKSSGTGTAIHTTPFYNRGGTVEVDSGTLCLSMGGSSSNGTFTVASGAVLDLTGGSSPVWAGTVGGSGAGTVLLNSGTLIASPNLTLSLPAGLFQWTGGTLQGTATNTSVVTIAGASTNLLIGVFYNRGLVCHTNAATLAIGDGQHFENQAGGVYDLAGDGAIAGLFYGSVYRGYFANYGLLRKSSGTGTATSTAPLYNQGGSVEVDSGTLYLSMGGSSSSGTFIVASGAALDLTGGSSPTWAGAITGTGAGTVRLSSGTLIASPSLTLNLPAGLFQWTGGTLQGTTTNTGVVTIAGASTDALIGVFYNRGLVRHTNTATLTIGDGNHFENLAGGVYDFTADGTVTGLFYGSVYRGYFANYGLLRKSSGVGTASIDNSFSNQGGAVEVDIGSLLVNTYSQGGGALTIALGGTNSGESGMLRVSGDATLNGPLNVVLANGFTPAVGQSFQILACGSRSGVFTATNMPVGMSLTYSNTGAYLLVTSSLPRTLENTAHSGTNFAFSFQTESGSSYTLQYNDDLRTTNWQFLQTVTGDGALQSFVIPITNGPRRFFRVRQP